MMTLVERLRDKAGLRNVVVGKEPVAWTKPSPNFALLREAADAIERLEKALETAREALEPFANRAGKLDGLWGENDTNWSPAYGDTAITVGDLRRAAAAIRTLSQKKEG